MVILDEGERVMSETTCNICGRTFTGDPAIHPMFCGGPPITETKCQVCGEKPELDEEEEADEDYTGLGRCSVCDIIFCQDCGCDIQKLCDNCASDKEDE